MKLRAGWVVFVFMAAAGCAFFGNARAWPVPETGQTACYDDVGNVIPCPAPGERFYGQDGNYSINPMSFTKLDGNGNALPDGASSWVMVRDNVTGLIWEVKRNKDGVKNYDDPRDADNTYTWYDPDDVYPGTPGAGTDTEDFIDDLNDANFGGYADWRMPSIKELASIVDLSIPYPGPTIRVAYFPNTAASWYWSCTTYALNTHSAWDVHFGNGSDYYSYKYFSGYVRAVRGGQ